MATRLALRSGVGRGPKAVRKTCQAATKHVSRTKKASPASLVGHLQNSRREVGDLLRLPDCSTRYPSYPFPPEGCQDCTYWLRRQGGRWVTENRKPIFLMFGNTVPHAFFLKRDFPENQNHTTQALFPAGQSDADFEF